MECEDILQCLRNIFICKANSFPKLEEIDFTGLFVSGTIETLYPLNEATIRITINWPKKPGQLVPYCVFRSDDPTALEDHLKETARTKKLITFRVIEDRFPVWIVERVLIMNTSSLSLEKDKEVDNLEVKEVDNIKAEKEIKEEINTINIINTTEDIVNENATKEENDTNPTDKENEFLPITLNHPSDDDSVITQDLDRSFVINLEDNNAPSLFENHIN